MGAGSGQRVRLIGFSVTGDPGSSYGSGQVTVSGLSSGNLLYQFVLTTQSGLNAASINQLNVVFPVPIEGTAGGTVSIIAPALGNSASIVVVSMQAVVY